MATRLWDGIIISVALFMLFHHGIAAPACTGTSHSSGSSKEKSRKHHKDDEETPKPQASFFFTNVGPHSFEYRAMFDHSKDPFSLQKNFNPFFENVQNFPNFPFLTFPNVDDIFQKKPKTSINSSPFHFPNLHPNIQRLLQPETEITTQVPTLPPPPVPIFRRKDTTDSPPPQEVSIPFPKYDIIRGKVHAEDYPKIFRFNEERINIDNFDILKKQKKEFGSFDRGDALDPERIDRNSFLILHGGVFTVKDPPLYSNLRNGNDIGSNSFQVYEDLRRVDEKVKFRELSYYYQS